MVPVNRTKFDRLIEEPAPEDLFQWCWQAILSSYADGDIPEVWGNTLQYLGFLDDLTTVGGGENHS